MQKLQHQFPTTQNAIQSRARNLRHEIDAKAEKLRSFDEVEGVDAYMGKPGAVLVKTEHHNPKESLSTRSSLIFDKESGQTLSFTEYTKSEISDSHGRNPLHNVLLEASATRKPSATETNSVEDLATDQNGEVRMNYARDVVLTIHGVEDFSEWTQDKESGTSYEARGSRSMFDNEPSWKEEVKGFITR